jgi:anti-sigma regulatory factor (Ser/Thr protein kinase)
VEFGATRLEPRRLSAFGIVREVAATAAQAGIVRDVVARWARDECGANRVLADDMRLAVYEALANVVEHAYQADDDGTMTVTAYLETGYLVVTVADSGTWRVGSGHPHGGRGLRVMHALSPRVDIDRGAAGTTVRLVWPLRR